jgi:hypothetical protein
MQNARVAAFSNKLDARANKIRSQQDNDFHERVIIVGGGEGRVRLTRPGDFYGPGVRRGGTFVAVLN